jgi:3-hydroxyacyl-CoA dehydrogenase/enoyl-CoA hydratase/3-hydroxybutyryl-CoA epimerase
MASAALISPPVPELTQFRVEPRDNGLIHFVFDCPDRSMNVFSNVAIKELGRFAEWLHTAEVCGVVVRSGKASGFCAGADLAELGMAYEMIVAAPRADRFDIAFNHFFPLSDAIRRLETAGKPVAAAIAGVALGGGCELALGCHYRVVTTSARSMMGLPECAVGLLPGAGGTQRMPRLVGLELGLEVLLLGRNLQGSEALEAGLIHQLVPEGEEIAAAEAWLLSAAANATQPWDRGDAPPVAHAAIAGKIDRHRQRELARMLGHEPAPLAILDCVEHGLVQPIDAAIRAEMSVFARLIQRTEPRNMIRTLFLGKQAWAKANKGPGVPAAVTTAAARIETALAAAQVASPDLRLALFGPALADHTPLRTRDEDGFWIEGWPDLLDALRPAAHECRRAIASLDEAELLVLDHEIVLRGALPAYLGGASGLAELVRN